MLTAAVSKKKRDRTPRSVLTAAVLKKKPNRTARGVLAAAVSGTKRDGTTWVAVAGWDPRGIGRRGQRLGVVGGGG